MECQIAQNEYRQQYINKEMADQRNAPTHLEEKIIKQYKIFQKQLTKPIAFTPDQLLRTIRTIVLSDNDFYLEESAQSGFLLDPLVHFSCFAEWEHLPFDRTPFINEILIQYTRLRSSFRVAEPFSLMHLIIKVLKKNNQATIPTCFNFNNLYATLISKKIVIFKIEEHLGEGCFGVVKKIESSSKRIEVIKIEKENPRIISSLETEWKMLSAIHYNGKQRGVQKLPAGMAYIHYEKSVSLALFENFYIADLDRFLDNYPNFITGAADLIRLFLPIFEMLAVNSTTLVHCDIRIDNILVKIKKGKIKLFLSDWGNGLFLIKEGDCNPILLKNFVEKKIKNWLKKEDNEEQFIPMEGNPEQIIRCTNQILLSRDVLGLGETVYDTLYGVYKAHASPESDADKIIWEGLLKDVGTEAAETFFRLINEMCHDRYELQEYAGVKIMFPRRPTMNECYERLKAIQTQLVP